MLRTYHTLVQPFRFLMCQSKHPACPLSKTIHSSQRKTSKKSVPGYKPGL